MCQGAISKDFVVLFVAQVRMQYASLMTLAFCMMPPWKPHRCTGPSHWTTSHPFAPAQLCAPTTPTLASGSCPILYMNRVALYSLVGNWTSAYIQQPGHNGFSSSRTTFTDTMTGTERPSACILVCHGSIILIAWQPCRISSTMWQTSLTPTL